MVTFDRSISVGTVMSDPTQVIGKGLGGHCATTLDHRDWEVVCYESTEMPHTLLYVGQPVASGACWASGSRPRLYLPLLLWFYRVFHPLFTALIIDVT